MLINFSPTLIMINHHHSSNTFLNINISEHITGLYNSKYIILKIIKVETRPEKNIWTSWESEPRTF